jgi:ferrochelatase
MYTEKTNAPSTVVLCNFGGPTGAVEVEPFLRRLFEDPFIIRTALLPPWLRAWLARAIARRRAPRVTAEYARIGYSPINRLTEAQARHLEARLVATRPGTRVLVCNRYTAPSADEVVAKLEVDRGRLFLITLYPHLCHSTTVSSLRDFDLALSRRFGPRRVGSTRIYSWWHHPRYLKLCAERLTAALGAALAKDPDPVTVLYSAHGIPERYDERGDPYVNEVVAHFEALVARASAWVRGQDGGKHHGRCQWYLTFQSRVGPVPWVRPYTDETIVKLGRERRGTLLIVPISFTSDHIETLWEMDHTYRELALSSGFTAYARVAPANDDPELAACLAELLLNAGL